MKKIEVVITSRERDLGGFHVRRVLPYATHRMVGPFIFFDHMGPVEFAPGEGIDVRPHPHINLATVTYLFVGTIRHRDSLGSDQLIQPGDINWMTAGHGIVHSERTPQALREIGGPTEGIQCWVALPSEYEEIAPSFNHYAADTLPLFHIERTRLNLLLGNAFGYQSPVATHSDLFYLDVRMPKDSKFNYPIDGRESAAYIVAGRVCINGHLIEQFSMAVVAPCSEMYIEALDEAHIMLLGGKPIGERFIYWNFVSSSAEKIEKAKADWSNGPGLPGTRFPKIPGDDQEFIPLPEEAHPKGTIM